MVLGTEQLYIIDNKCVKLTEQLVLKPHHWTRQKNGKPHHGKGGRGGGVEEKNLADRASKEYEWLITSTGVLYN